LLDAVIMNKTPGSLRAFASYELNVGKARAYVHHWQAQEIRVEAEPPQTVWIDGEAHGQTPFTAKVIPHAVDIVVP
jgi:diacylglycerol kinase family enzyme